MRVVTRQLPSNLSPRYCRHLHPRSCGNAPRQLLMLHADNKSSRSLVSSAVKTKMDPAVEVYSMPSFSPPASEKISPALEENEMDDMPPNGLHFDGAPFDLEDVHDYEPGGNHPAHLGDMLGQSRYRVVHKLGDGGTGVIWLCRDLQADAPTYVALRILAELSTNDCPKLIQGQLLTKCEDRDGSEAICLFLDQFRLDGPNSSHLCFIYPVLGPKVSSGLLGPSEDLDKILREICRVIVRSMAFLHRQGRHM